METPELAPPVMCPECTADAVTVLDYSSSIAYVWYLRCSGCGSVWTVSKSVEGARPVVRAPLSIADKRG